MVMTKHGGFTLIELMVVVSVVGVLAMIGLPSMRDLILNQQVKTAASDMHVALLYTRSEAIKRNTSVEMTATAGWAGGWDMKLPSSTTLRRQDPLDGLTVECNTDSDASAETCPSTLTFSRSGRPDSYLEYRIFVNGNDKVTMRCVSVSLSGMPMVELDSDFQTANGCN